MLLYCKLLLVGRELSDNGSHCRTSTQVGSGLCAPISLQTVLSSLLGLTTYELPVAHRIMASQCKRSTATNPDLDPRSLLCPIVLFIQRGLDEIYLVRSQHGRGFVKPSGLQTRHRRKRVISHTHRSGEECIYRGGTNVMVRRSRLTTWKGEHK